MLWYRVFEVLCDDVDDSVVIMPRSTIYDDTRNAFDASQ